MEQKSSLFAVITGASRGIGFELAKVFAKNGYDLLIVADSEAIYEAARDLGTLGIGVDAIQADLADYEGVEKLWNAAMAMGRPVDVIAINAGIGVGGRFSETDLAQELKLIQLNVTSSVHLAKRAVQHMLPRGSGKILFTSSIAGTMPTPLEAVYGASKAFVLSFSQSLRFELKDTGISITALQPGATDTNFFHRAGMDNTQIGTEGKHENDPAEARSKAMTL